MPRFAASEQYRATQDIHVLRLCDFVDEVRQVVGRRRAQAGRGIENARLLLASTQAMPQGLANDRDVVGRYFAEHMQLDSAAVLPLEQKTSYDLYGLDLRHKPIQPIASGRAVGLSGYLTL